MGHRGSFRTPAEHIEFIVGCFASPKAHPHLHIPARAFLLIHNIDGPALRTPQAQSVLSLLASIPQLSIVASIDHINAPMLWDNSMHQVKQATMYVAANGHRDLIGSGTRLTPMHATWRR